MSIMFPPGQHSTSATRANVRERRFRLSLRCNECAHEKAVVVSMVDEPNDPGSEEEFAASGALDRVDACERCGCEHATLTRLHYVKDPTDV